MFEGIQHFYDCLEEAEEHGLVVGLMERPRCNGKPGKVIVKGQKKEEIKVWVDELTR